MHDEEQYIDHNRLFDKLKVEGQKRQIIFCGGEDDLFLTTQGEAPVDIEGALKRYLVKMRYDMIITMNRSIYSTKVSVICPDIKDTMINDMDFKDTQEDSLYKNVKISIDKMNPAAKVAIIFLYPDTMLLSADPLREHMVKLQIISSFAREKKCMSILVLDENRAVKFNQLLDWVLNNNEYSVNYIIEKPTAEIFKAFLNDAAKEKFYICNDPDSIAATAAAEGSSLKNFAARLQNFIKSSGSNLIKLDDLYLDEEKVKNLDEIKERFFSLVGLDEIKKYVQDLIDAVNMSKENAESGLKENKIKLPHFLFTGNPGTGKTMVARLLGQLFLNLGLRKRKAFVEISFSEMGEWHGEIRGNMLKKIREAAGGILFIDEAYIFAEDESGKQALQTLMKEMEDQRDTFTVIMTSYRERVSEIFNINPGFKSRIGKVIHFPDYTEDELVAIIKNLLRNEKIQCPFTAEKKIQEYILSFVKRGGIGNGRGARNLFDMICSNFYKRITKDRKLIRSDIPDPMQFHQKEAEDFLKRFDQDFIGITRVKKLFRNLYKQCIASILRPTVDNRLQPNNCIFSGNPGTGKTSVARLMGRFFYYLGMVSEKDKVVEIDVMSDLTSCYYGEYAKKVKAKFDEAVGGVLFIDEAYQLTKDQQGLQIIDQMVRLMTEPRYLNMVVIFAGYPDEMQTFYKTNPGLKRRCPYEFHFDDFSISELIQIFNSQMDKLNLKIGGNIDAFNIHLSTVLGRMASQRHFGNAGAVINYFRNTVLGNQAERLQQHQYSIVDELLYTDLLDGECCEKHALSEILKRLDRNFIGMVPLKSAVKRIAARIKLRQLRTQNQPVCVSSPCYNMRFIGNPGTGKTSIARCMAEIFCSLDIISTPRVREYRGVDLKGSYVGQTKDRVNKLFEDNPDSVVLIDEIYSLFPDDPAHQDAFGMEAVDTLVGCMTDPKNMTTIIIIAGYENKMNAFLEANQGLSDRFPMEIRFPDYSDSECLEIFQSFVKKDGFYVKDEKLGILQSRVRKLLSAERNAMGTKFGNVRTVKKIYDQIIDSMSERVSQYSENEINSELLNTIEPDLDIPEFNDW